jgi:hypothetical protein
MSKWLDYLARDLDAVEAAGLEEALFEGREDPAEALWVESLVTQVRWLSERGTYWALMTGSQADALRQRLRALVVRAGAQYRPDVDENTRLDLMLTYFDVDLTGVTRLEIENVGLDGTLRWKRDDVPFVVGEPVVLACEAELMARYAMTDLQGAVVRFISVEGQQRRVLAEFQGRRPPSGP